MSNVVKLKKKKPDITAWKEQIEVLGDRFTDRLNDAISLSDADAEYENIPEEFADCTILGVLVSALVRTTEARNIIGPEALLKLVEYQIHRPREDEDDAS